MWQICCKPSFALINSWFKPLCNITYCMWDVYSCPCYIRPSQVHPFQPALPITCQHLCIFLHSKICCIHNFSRPEVTCLLLNALDSFLISLSCIVNVWPTWPAGQEAFARILNSKKKKKKHSDSFTAWKQKLKFRLFSNSKVDRLTWNVDGGTERQKGFRSFTA